MKPEPIFARTYIDRLAAAGRYHFTSADTRHALDVSPEAARQALNKLSRQGLIVASPARGFYVIVPPEYRSLGCLLAEQFIPALMAQKDRPYYAGLLSAAQYYGAAHQRPQEFQVFLEKNRRPISCGRVRFAFIARKQIERVPVKKFNTARGEILVSTPEATAIDLAGYPRHAGGHDHVATILSELAEQIDSVALTEAADTALYKLHIRPPARYSENIDLVQVNAEPAGPVMDALREVLDPWLRKPRYRQSEESLPR